MICTWGFKSAGGVSESPSSGSEPASGENRRWTYLRWGEQAKVGRCSGGSSANGAGWSANTPREQHTFPQREPSCMRPGSARHAHRGAVHRPRSQPSPLNNRFQASHHFVHTYFASSYMVAPLRCEPKPNPVGLLPITSRPLFVYKMLHRGVSHHAAACRPAAPATRLLVVCMVSTPLSHALQLGPPPCLAHSPLASASHQVSSRRFPPGGMRLGASPILPAVQCALPSPPFLHPFCSTTPSALGFPLVLSSPTHLPPPATPLRRSPLTPKTSSPPLAPPAPKAPPLAPHTPPQNSRPRPLPIPQTSPPSSLRPTPGVSPRCSPRSSARSATCCTTTR